MPDSPVEPFAGFPSKTALNGFFEKDKGACEAGQSRPGEDRDLELYRDALTRAGPPAGRQDRREDGLRRPAVFGPGHGAAAMRSCFR